MGAERDDPPPAPGAQELDAEARPAGAPERFGPLVLRRFVTSDGRALILYQRPPER